MTIHAIRQTIRGAFDGVIMNPIREQRTLYRRRMLEGNWYFDAIRYSHGNGTFEVKPRKWNLILGNTGEYRLYGDAPLGVAKLITKEGRYQLSVDGNLVFHEMNDTVRYAYISKLTRRELVYYIDGSMSGGRQYYSFIKL